MQTKLASDTIEMICRISPVISTPRLRHVHHAGPLAQALTRGRLPVIQISIRDRNAAAIIREMSQVPDAIVGAGMILSPDDVRIARDAGAKFCSTPGVTDPLLRYFDGVELPLLPGVATPTEAMHLLSRGYTMLNLYPGGTATSPDMLKAILRPMPQIRFSVAGDVSAANIQSFLDIPNVLNIASDCVAPTELIETANWNAIAQKARELARLKH